MNFIKLLALFLGFFLSLNCIALTGKVVSISDGDTITILDHHNISHKIRLAGIDAPEKRQAYGNESKKNLSNLIYSRTVTVIIQKNDKYGRKIGKVLLNDIDISLSQIESGLAWHYIKYSNEQSIHDKQLYSITELNARKKKIGLWRESDPIPPWDFRNKSK